jgi:hypothetical protein
METQCVFCAYSEKETNPPLLVEGETTASKHINGLGTNMDPDGARTKNG